MSYRPDVGDVIMVEVYVLVPSSRPPTARPSLEDALRGVLAEQGYDPSLVLRVDDVGVYVRSLLTGRDRLLPPGRSYS